MPDKPAGEWIVIRSPTLATVVAALMNVAVVDPEAKRIEIESRLAQLLSPFRTAEAFGIEEIIDPRDTRPLLCDFVKQAQEITATQLEPKSRVGIRP